MRRCAGASSIRVRAVMRRKPESSTWANRSFPRKRQSIVLLLSMRMASIAGTRSCRAIPLASAASRCLLFACPKRRHQEKGHPASPPARLRLRGRPHCARSIARTLRAISADARRRRGDPVEHKQKRKSAEARSYPVVPAKAGTQRVRPTPPSFPRKRESIFSCCRRQDHAGFRLAPEFCCLLGWRCPARALAKPARRPGENPDPVPSTAATKSWIGSQRVSDSTVSTRPSTRRTRRTRRRSPKS